MGDEDRTESYSINVKYITGAVIHIQCSPEETVEFVKLRLQLINGVSTECQHLIWNSVDLDNDFTLKDYGIPDQAEISLAVAMRAAPVLSKSDHEYFIDMAEAIREIEQQNAQCEQQNNGHDQGCEGGSRDDAAFLFLDAHCDADSSTFSEGTAPVNQDLQNVLEEIEAKRVEESVLRGKVEQLQEKMKKEKKKRVKRKVYEEEEEKSILKEAVTDLELSEMKKKLNTVRCLWNNNNEAGGQFETAENTQGENSSYDGRTAQARLDKFESKLINSKHIEEKSLYLNPVKDCSHKEYRSFEKRPAQKQQSSSSASMLSVSPLPLFSNRKSAELTFEPSKCRYPHRITSRNISVAKKESVPFLRCSVHDSSTLNQHVPKNIPPSPTSVLTHLNTDHITKLSCPKDSVTVSHNLRVADSNSSKRFMNMNSWVDRRPKTMPQETLYIDSYIENRIYGIDLSLPRVHSKKRDRVLSKDILHLSFPPDYKRNQFAQSLLKEGGCKWSMKSPLPYRAPVDISGILPKLPISSVARTGIKGFPSTLKNDVGVSFSRTEGLMDRFSDGLKNMWKYENDPDFGEKVRKEILESGAIPKLPPINIKRRCSLCKRKTGVCSTFKCRCGFEFCTEHRYPEAHSCTYDFKAEGKNIIRKNNPLVQAPKLPKI